MSRVTSSTLSKNHICSTFRKQAFSTWNLLRKSRVNDFQPGEETITDMNLLEIKMKHPQEVFIQKFTKRQEAKTGADWEWWFTGSSGKWLGFRIQAKVINIDTLSFPHLYYKSSRIYQTDKLIQDAFKERPHKIPLYCLYTNWNTQSMSYPWHCYSFKKSAKSYGCSILPAFWVKYLLQEGKQPTLKSVIPYMPGHWRSIFWVKTRRVIKSGRKPLPAVWLMTNFCSMWARKTCLLVAPGHRAWGIITDMTALRPFLIA